MADVKFEDNRIQIQNIMHDKAVAWLYESAGEIQSQTARNSRVGSGQVKGSWSISVDEDKLEAQVGSTLENAIWEEFGTGEYAINKNGRKTPWYVPVDRVAGRKKPTYNGKVIVVRGKNGVEYYKTNGKKPNRALHNAFTQLKSKLIKRAESEFKG